MNLSTAKMRILYRFWKARKYNEKFFLNRRPDIVISGGWLPLWAVNSPLIGGTSADRRIRDLRAEGIPFDYKIHKYQLNGKTKLAHIYRLKQIPKHIDWNLEDQDILEEFKNQEVEV